MVCLKIKLMKDWWNNLSTTAKWVVIILGLAFIGYLVGDNNCGCSDNDIVSLQRQMGISRESAIDMCCEFERIANE